MKNALAADAKERYLWLDVTSLARWDLIHWINGTRNPETLRIRIVKRLSKLKAGKRTACCFDRSACTDPDVSIDGMLLEPGRVLAHRLS